MNLKALLRQIDQEKKTIVDTGSAIALSKCTLPPRIQEPRIVRSASGNITQVEVPLNGYFPATADEVLAVAQHLGEFIHTSDERFQPTPHDSSCTTLSTHTEGRHQFDLRAPDTRSAYSTLQFAQVLSGSLGFTPGIIIRPIGIAPLDMNQILTQYAQTPSA